MYHEQEKHGLGAYSYYDGIAEIPDRCTVEFPDGRKKVMTGREMMALAANEDWYVVVADHNFGVCDHWISISFLRWVAEWYPRIIEVAIYETGCILGYNRRYHSVTLTHNAHFHYSEVWNS